MKKLSKLVCSLILTISVLFGCVLSGCAETANYTEEIKEYQAKLEELQQENAQLKEQLEQLGVTGETQSEAGTETADAGEIPTETEPEETQPAGTQQAEDESTAQADGTQAQEENQQKELTQILVLGDSIWGNYRDDTSIAARVEYYMNKIGQPAKVYNAAIGGTRATLQPDDNPYKFGPASDCSLAKMASILNEETDVELLQGKAAYDDMKAALQEKSDIDLVIIAYGMNDFLSQAPINDSENPWTGFGTALTQGVLAVRRACPQAQIMIVAPTYASYFSIPVQNMGEKALYNYASVACDVAKGSDTLCVDGYYALGIDAYNADDYIEDGVHLNERGRNLYAQHVVSCLIGGRTGEISGNTIFDFGE